MSYYTYLIENDDIQFNSDGSIKMTKDSAEGLGQSYKILLETAYGSDLRDTDYGLKIQEFYQSTYSNKEELLDLFIRETLISHPQTEAINEIDISIDSSTRIATVNVTVLTILGEIIEFTVNLG
jgi:phage baseplate assembly protein W